MRIVKAVSFEQEVLRDYETEHRGYDGYEISLKYLHEANTRWQGRWSLVRLNATDIANIILPGHNHPITVVPPSGLSVFDAVQRFKQIPKDQIPECWKRISAIETLDFSKMHIALQMEGNILKHVDGVHRLLAYSLFDKDDEVSAYVAANVDLHNSKPKDKR
jgi:hypothetical protein